MFIFEIIMKMKREHQLSLQANRLLGEYIGSLNGILSWDNMPSELRENIRKTLFRLNNTKLISVIKCGECKSKGKIDGISCDKCGGEGYL
jgi:hypothetical protein